ncbi:MAG TPA: protein-export chaperone SecB [bacterium]|nr:protein-export chaperone SecB [bacterium]
MEVKKAPIDIKKFTVLSVHLDAVPVPKDHQGKKLPEPPIDIDFSVLNAVENERLTKVVLKVGANLKRELPGYSFQIVCEGLFEYTEKMPPEEREKALFLALPILFHSGRGYLLNLTAAGVYGPFNLPMPDINELFARKKAAVTGGKGKKVTA